VRFTFTPTLEEFREVTYLITRLKPWPRSLTIGLTVIGLISLVLGYLIVRDFSAPLAGMFTTIGPYLVLVAMGVALIRGWFRGWLLWIAIVVACALIAAMVQVAHPDRSPARLAWDLAPYAFIIVLWIAYAVVAPIQATRTFKTNRFCHAETTLELTPDEVRFVTADTSSAIRWGAFARVIETPRYVLFFLTKTRAAYLPTRVVPPGELAALRAFLQPHLGVVADAHGALRAN
jgi:hypothetical protein